MSIAAEGDEHLDEAGVYRLAAAAPNVERLHFLPKKLGKHLGPGNAVRQHLDNDPHRWRIMVRRLMEAGPLEYAQLVDLVEAVGDGAGEAAEGEP